MKKEPSNCPICGCDPKALTRCFSHEPFIDGRTYDFICHTCACVPKKWEYKDGEMIVFEHQSPSRLNTVEDMVSDGWAAERAAKSIKAVQRLLRNPKIVLAASKHVFAELFILDKITPDQLSPC